MPSAKQPMLVELCAALDASGKACSARTKEGSKWCPKHDEERIKLYVNYKTHHAALDAFPEHTICHNANTIMFCTSFDTIKSWNKSLITKYQLLSRCIEARAYFTERFFGNDMDFGHKTFWHCLMKQRAEIEQLMLNVENRAYELILAAQNALWVLERQTDGSEPQEDCSGHEDRPLGITAARQRSQATMALSDIEDPLDVALRQKTWELWEKIRTRLARYCAPSFSKYYQERFKVIWAVVRRAIYTDSALMLVAQNYKNVMTLLKDTDLDVSIVEKLWNAIKNLYVHDVRAAVDDVLRPKDDPGDYVVVLGGKVFKELSCRDFPLHAWGHMTAFFLCYSCVRKICKTVDEVIALTRFVVLTRSVLAQSGLKYEFDYEGSRALTLCGFVPNAIEDLGPRFVVNKCNCLFKKNTPHWEETKNTFVICAGLSLNDPKSQVFVNACLRHPDFMVLVRKGADGRIIRSTEHIWASRTRQAVTRAGLKKVPWESVQESTCFKDTLLEEAQPLISCDARITDCFQVAIVDHGEGDLEDFVNKLVEVWLQVYEVDDVLGLLYLTGNPFIEDGEIEFNRKRVKTGFPLVPNTELDVVLSYERLWGAAPRQGQLADDEVATTTILVKA